jgi:hypothetical protein
MTHVYFNYLKKIQAISCCQHFTVHSELNKAFKFLVNPAMWQENTGAGENDKGRIKTEVLSIF